MTAPARPGMAATLWRRFRRHWAAVGGLVVIVVLGCASVGVSLFVPEAETLALRFAEKLEPPGARHWFGTNELGQDVFLRCLYGGRVSLRVGIEATVVALLAGVLLGALAGAAGGVVDGLVMKLVDVMLAIPIFFVLLLLASYFGANLHLVTLVIGLSSWPDVCRLVRADFLSLREKEFVEAAWALGATPARVVWRHLLPNAASPIIVAATLGVARAIIVESALSYLGFGSQPPNASWGYMLRNAQSHITEYPWLAFFPGALIFATVLAFNFVGDGLRDALDPRT
ncbi:MAG: ABC transporter permease [Candidatus Schekmanbacteria bacterium]|nr:ABC transporter permease [Candidatus Schekmanbacteria bacterium]